MACNHCGEDRFGNGAQLQCHVAKNHATFSCNCSKKFMTEKDLLAHEEDKKSHEKDSACTGCCRSFDRDTDLWNHKRDTKHWKPDERNEMRDTLGIHPCDDRCGRIFKSERGLNDHRRDKAGIFADKDKTCNGCANTFQNSDVRAQHMRDTGHRGKSKKEYIDTLYKRDVALSKHDKQASVKTIDKVLGEIMDDVTKADGGHIYDHNVRKAGSYPIKMKIGKADEFDTQIFMNTTPTVTITRGKVTYTYNKMDRKDGTDNNMNINRTITDQPNGVAIPNGYGVLKTDDGTIPNHLVHKGDLQPRAVKQDLFNKMTDACKDMEGVYLSKHSHGPALTLTIVPKDGGHHTSVDITPTVRCTQPASLSRPDFIKAYDAETRARVETAGYCFVPKQNEFWLKSNNNMAQELLSKIDAGNGCRRYVNNILKKEVMTCTSRSSDGLPGVSSHILKHHILWCSEQEGIKDGDYWKKSNVDNCLIDTMKGLEKCLYRGKLPDYFNTALNILDGKDPQVLRHLADYMKSRRMDILHM